MENSQTYVGALIVNQKTKEILLVKGPKFGDLYIVPGGKPEKKETLQETLFRELFEEIKFEGGEYKVFCTSEPFYCSGEIDDFLVNQNNSSELYDFIIICKDSFKDKIKLDRRELESYEWIDPEKALETLKIEKYTQKFIKKYLKNINQFEKYFID